MSVSLGRAVGKSATDLAFRLGGWPPLGIERIFGPLP